MSAGPHVHELNVYPKSITAALHRTFKYIMDVQLAPDLLEVNRFAFVANAVCRPITNDPMIRERSVVRLSVTPSTK
jgi:hypothetical protein